MSSDVAWLQQWYRSQCDGDWEHSYGVSIDTLDNPGWRVTIDLAGTRYETLAGAPVNLDASADDWLQCSVRDRKFDGAGDPSKLEAILSTFRTWIEAWDREHGGRA